MRSKRLQFAGACCGCFLLLAQFGCSNLNKTQNGALIGAGAGAGLGAIVGKQLGSTGAGAAIGALAGTASGALIGNAADEHDRRETAERQASYERAYRAREARACDNRDVIDMTRSGLSDRVIVSTIQNRGGRFDLSPSGIVSLHENGVSDAVIQAMQREDGR